MPLNPTSTRELLTELGHAPNKKLGQNFLIDGNIVRKSIQMADLQTGEQVVEIGPGLGTLSREILETGANLWAVERDPTLAEHLRQNVFSGRKSAHLVEGDCLEFPRGAMATSIAEDGFKIVANLPYAVSTPWMDAILSGPLPERMVLMLQKEAADRYVSAHGRKLYGAISIFLQSAFEETDRHLVAANCFHPAPKVDSILLRIDRRRDAFTFGKAQQECIRRIFTQRRKQLGSLCRRDPYNGAQPWFTQLLENGFKETIRPEEVPVSEWRRL